MEHPRVAGVPHGQLSPGFLEILDKVLPTAGDAIDLGTGTGRVALMVAPRARRVVGVDVDEGALEAARTAARRSHLSNVEFFRGDAEAMDLKSLNDGRPFSLATAHLFLSVALLSQVASALEPSGHFVTSAFASDHWNEAGGSRFNLNVDDVVARLDGLGLACQRTAIEAHVHQFADSGAAQEYLKGRRLWGTWKRDGRWDAWKAHIRRGDASLTESRMLVWAQKLAMD